MTSFAALDMSVDDLKRLKSNIVQGMDAIRGVATDVLEVCEADEVRENLELLKEHMKALIKEEYDAASYAEAADTLKQQARRQNVAPDKMKDVLYTAYEASRAQQPNPEHHVAFKGLLNMVPVVEEGGSCEDLANDDSMLVSEENLQWKDPITQSDIEHPVKNTVCGHIYDKNSIAHYIKTTKHPSAPPKFKFGVKEHVAPSRRLPMNYNFGFYFVFCAFSPSWCPYLGCRNPRSLRSTELVDDLYVMRFLKERAASK